MKTNESAENYLETILILSKKLPVVRSVDIATELGFKKSSVSVAMKHLREKNHITVTDAGFIYLTEEGKEIADMIYGGTISSPAALQHWEYLLTLQKKMPARSNMSSAGRVSAPSRNMPKI